MENNPAMFETTNQVSMCIHWLVTIFISFPYDLIAIWGSILHQTKKDVAPRQVPGF
jgi:hypothetical protein